MKTCIIAIAKRENLYLKEWIEHHLNIGFDVLFLCDNNECDGERITDIIDDDRVKVLDYRGISGVQPIAYTENFLRYKDEFDWLAFIDIDEFIMLDGKYHGNIKNFLSEPMFDDADAVRLFWKILTSETELDVKDGDYRVLDRLKDVHVSGEESLFKSIVRGSTKYVGGRFNGHCYMNMPYGKTRSADGEHRDGTSFRGGPVYVNAWINHYPTKTIGEYVRQKYFRGGPNFNDKIYHSFRYFFTYNDKTEEKVEYGERLVQELLPEYKDKAKRIMEKKLVVLPYRQSGSQGNEIRIALKGWRKFCQFKYHFIVIGEFDQSLKEEFPWVEFIYSPLKERKPDQYMPHLDIQRKMKEVMERYGDIYDGFIYMSDDKYAIKPFDLDTVTRVFYHSPSFTGREDNPTSFWNHDKWKTRKLLDRENLPHINYTTHHPYYLEFKKLKEIWNKFNMLEESYVFDDVYFNYFKHEEPVLDSKIRLGIWDKTIFKKEFKKAVENPEIKFVCNSVDGWSKELETELEKIVN